MNAKSTPLSFGSYLQSIRLEKGISLEEISKETRIRKDNLLLIEREDHEHLPAQIFVKGFLRAYAKAIGADDKEAIRRYEDRYKSYLKVINSEAMLIQLKAGVWSSLRIVLGIIFCLIVLSVYSTLFISKSSLREDRTSPPELKPRVNTSDQAKGSSDAGATSMPVPANAKTGEKKLLLEVTAVKDTWMKVIVDGQSAEKFDLSSGDRLEFEALSGFNLLIGDASGVQLLLNNSPYEVAGVSGQAVTIQIP